MLAGCSTTTTLQVRADKLIEVIPDHLLQKCSALELASSADTFFPTVIKNTALHQRCRSRNNALVQLILDAKTKEGNR